MLGESKEEEKDQQKEEHKQKDDRQNGGKRNVTLHFLVGRRGDFILLGIQSQTSTSSFGHDFPLDNITLSSNVIVLTVLSQL
jgi:hypothetical protein